MPPSSIDNPADERPSEAAFNRGTGPQRRGSSSIAWIAIVLTIGTILTAPFRHESEAGGDSSIVLPEIQAKYLVAAFNRTVLSKDDAAEQIQDTFDHGPIQQQLMGIILTREIVGQESAMKLIHRLNTQIATRVLKVSDQESDLVQQLESVFKMTNGEETSDAVLDESTQKLFSDKLGWAGRLALLPEGTSHQAARSAVLSQADRTLAVILGVFGFAVVAVIIGSLLQITWWFKAMTGKLIWRTPQLRGSHALYAETFALWLMIYLALSFLVSRTWFSKFGLGLVIVPQIVSLTALAWPIFRGLHWHDVREDIGLFVGRPRWKQPLIGVAAYLSALPLVGVGMLITLVMLRVASQFLTSDAAGSVPVHPIVEPLLRGQWTVRMQIVFVAVFAAIPEEIMFRGFLYRHLREAGTMFGQTGKVVMATIVSSFIFAVIHPQGLLGIPILMSLAIVFAIVREWQGSLIPSMIAHAMVNAGTSCMLVLMAD